MAVTTIDLYDVGPFNKFRADLTGRMVGITGANGSGKSTILKSIAFAFTGDTLCLGRRDAARIGRTATDQPHVVLAFETFDGRPAAVCRWLPVDKKPGRHRLTVDEKVTATADEIARWVEGEFGLSLAAAREILFVDQGKLTDVIAAPNARRAETFQKAFGLEAAARAYDAAVAHLSGLPAPADDGTVTAARDRVADLQAQVYAATAALMDCTVPPADAVAAARAVVAGHARHVALEPVRHRLTAAAAAAEARLARPAVPPADPTARAFAEARLVAAEAYARWIATAQAAVERMNALVARRDKLVENRVPAPGPAPVPGPRLTELRERAWLTAYVAKMPDVTGTTCPVCTGPYAPERSARSAAAAEVAEAADLEAAHAQAVRAHRAAAEAYGSWVASVTHLSTEIGIAETELRTDPPPDPRTSVDDARRDLDAVLAADRSFQVDAGERSAAENQLRDRRADLAVLESDVPPLPSEEELCAARTLVESAARAEEVRRGLEAKEAVLSAALREARLALTAAEAARTAGDRVKAHREDVAELVAVLHRDAAPAAAATAALANLTKSVNDRLEQVGAAYRAGVSADGEIVCTFADGSPVRRAGLLSPGQQMTLAIAWRVAVVDRHCPRAGVLCLDEPTTGLDETRIAALRSALDAWRAVGSGPQFVVVTHDRRLCGAFDRVVDL